MTTITSVAFLCSFVLLQSTEAFSNVNFVDYISDAPKEVSKWKALTETEGIVPPFLHGTFVRNGAALWSFGDQRYSHWFDGMAKLTAYRIEAENATNNASSPTTAEGTSPTKVQFQSRFIESSFYKKVTKHNRLFPIFSIGPILKKDEPHQTQLSGSFWDVARAIYHTISFDNACVNVWHYRNQKSLTATTDAACRAEVDLNSLATLSSSSLAPQRLRNISPFHYEFLETAHPVYSQTDTNTTYNVAITLTLRGPQIALVAETTMNDKTTAANQRRVVGGPVPSPDGVPYIHSFGLSDRHAVLWVHPLRTNIGNLSEFVTKGYFRSLLHVPQSRVIVWDLRSEQVVLDQMVDESIYCFHTISCCSMKDENIVSLRLCAYSTPDILTGEDQLLRLERCQESAEARNRLTRGGTFCDIDCNLKEQQVSVRWIPTKGQGFELPTTRYTRSDAKVPGQHPQYVYAYGTFFGGCDEYDAWGLFKFAPDREKEEDRVVAFFREESVYFSEPIFVPDPAGKEEDDGIVLCQIYDGKRRETALLTLDAQTMAVISKTWTGARCPLDFHGGWFPTSLTK